MIRNIQQGERIAEKNVAKAQFRRNSCQPKTGQPTILQIVTHLWIAAENPSQTQFRSRKRILRMISPFRKKLGATVIPCLSRELKNELPRVKGFSERNAKPQSMAKNSHQDRMAVAFQTVAMVSMAIMSVTATAHLIRELLREKKGRGRG